MTKKRKYYELDETGFVGSQTITTDKQKKDDIKRTTEYIQNKIVFKTATTNNNKFVKRQLV